MAMMYSLAVFLPQRLAQIGVTEPVLVSVFMAGTASLAGLGYAKARQHFSYAALLRFAFAILGTASEPAVLAASTVLFGLGQAMAFSALTALMGDIAPASLLGRATAISGTVVFLGQFCSPLLIGPVIEATSITTGYLVVAAAAAAILLALSLTRISGGQAREPEPAGAPAPGR